MTVANYPRNDTSLRWLYVDFNSYFASVEQQINPYLRGKPVAVMAADTDSTCAIAASYEAKAFGIKTGTPIYEAKKMCKELLCVPAQHERYVEYHHRLIAEINQHVPVESVCSIDEVACHLLANETAQVEAIATRIKAGIKAYVGEYIRCSIGVAPNRFLAKIATDMQKPDGFTILRQEDLPHALTTLKLSDIPGIGFNMERRLARAGIWSMSQLLALSREEMVRLWHSTLGERMWYSLRGIELPEQETTRRTIGHSHILAPELRAPEQAYLVAKRLTLKAASRLRRMEYDARACTLSLRFVSGERARSTYHFPAAQDSVQCMHALAQLWQSIMQQQRHGLIKKVSVTLHDLIEKRYRMGELFSHLSHRDIAAQLRAERMSSAMDKLNQRFGRDTIVMGMLPSQGKSFSGTKIAFTRIPDASEFHE